MISPAFGISTLGAFGISPLGICGYEWNDDGNRGEGWIASTSIPYGPAFAFYFVLFFTAHCLYSLHAWMLLVEVVPFLVGCGVLTLLLTLKVH